MKNILIILFCFAAGHNFLAAQERTMGLLNEDVNYKKLEKVARFSDGSKLGESKLGEKYSLKKYVPTPMNQEKSSACVGYAIGYYAMSIMYATLNNWTEAVAKDKNAFSAMYIYNQIRKPENCNSGAFLTDAFEKVLKQKGNLKFEDFDKKSPNDCKLKIDEQINQEAQKYRIETVVPLFDAEESVDVKKEAIRKSLRNNKPVVVGIETYQGFDEFGTNTDYYLPDYQHKNKGLHAMTVIAYDQNSFELVNSWGTGWGDKGFCRIKYADFGKLCLYAYNFDIEKPKDGLKGSFDLVSDFSYDSEDRVQSISQEVNWNGKMYETDKKYAINDQFQGKASEMTTGKCVYAFSIDANNQAAIHWTPNKNGEIPYHNDIFVVPSEEDAMEKQLVGDDYLCILYCSQKIDTATLHNSIKAITQNRSGSFLERFEKAFDGLLIPSNEIVYDKNKMQFHSISQNGIIAPMILKIK